MQASSLTKWEPSGFSPQPPKVQLRGVFQNDSSYVDHCFKTTSQAVAGDILILGLDNLTVQKTTPWESELETSHLEAVTTVKVMSREAHFSLVHPLLPGAGSHCRRAHRDPSPGLF